MCREMCYLEAANLDKMEKSVYLSCESWIVAASNQPEINALAHLSGRYDNRFGPLFESSERNVQLATSYWEVITQSSFTELGCWQQEWQLTVPEHSPLNSENASHWTLFPWSGACVPGVSYTAFSQQGLFLMLLWGSESNGRSSTSSCDCRVFAALSLKEMHMGSFASSLGSQLC